jgi:hypothetical protein
MTSVTTASSDVLSTYTYSDLQDTTWDDGGYVNVTIINEASDVLVLSATLSSVSIIEGFGDLHLDPSVQLKWYTQVPTFVEGVGVTVLDEVTGPLYLDPSPVIVNASSNIPVDTNIATISSDDVFISLAPNLLPDPIDVITTVNETLVITNAILSVFNIKLDIIINTPIIPTWRWPYVGYKGEIVSIHEELIALRLKEDVYISPINEELVTLNLKEDVYVAPMTEEVFSISIEY